METDDTQEWNLAIEAAREALEAVREGVEELRALHTATRGSDLVGLAAAAFIRMDEDRRVVELIDAALVALEPVLPNNQ